ncbi:hypothetical protein [Methylobacterium sp. BTF04]|uniref:hypothetical protein n=1 Tax=Methylobacterium sp. BTF04 TaxID=2708300 RepID=UPI001FEFEC6C|nr:hypothetical protein [Methylobacterium sp. BTF04]
MSDFDIPDHLAFIKYKTASEILSHSKFEEAREVYIARTARVYATDVFPTRMSVDAGRVLIFGAIICLHARHDPSDRETWPTLKLLKTVLVPFGLNSPRLVDDVVGRLVQTGYLELPQIAADRRLRSLQPTEKLLAWDREWIAAYHAPLDVLYPDPGYAGPRLRDEAFQAVQRRAAIAIFPISARILSKNPEMRFFLTMASGNDIMLALFGMGAGQPDSRIRSSSFAVIGQRFGLSRSHVRNVVRAAEERGFAARTGPRGQYVQLTPKWRAAFDRFIAETLSSSDLTYRMALRSLSDRTWQSNRSASPAGLDLAEDARNENRIALQGSAEGREVLAVG